MKIYNFVMVGAVLAGAAGICSGADLSQVERSLVKEPEYASQPQYCLLVFGPEAKMRVWLAFDGKTVYVDQNANGDLTDEPEQATMGKEFRPIEIGGPDGKARHQILRIYGDGKGRVDLFVKVRRQYGQHGGCELADNPQQAPILHFDGPRKFQLLEQPQLVPGQPAELRVGIGTPGLGRDAFTYLSVEAESPLPEDVHPVAEIAYPAKSSSEEPVIAKIPLSFRC